VVTAGSGGVAQSKLDIDESGLSDPQASVFLPTTAARLERAYLEVGLAQEALRRLGDDGGLKGKRRLGFDGQEVIGYGVL
jgi:hypothetical protein